MDFTNTQKSRYLENERSFFLKMKKLIDYSSRTTLWQEITTPFIAFKIFSLICSLKFNFMSKYTPKCFWQCAWWTSISLMAYFLKNITSWASLLTSGLNDTFHLCAHSDNFCRSLFNTPAEVLLSCTTENRKV